MAEIPRLTRAEFRELLLLQRGPERRARGRILLAGRKLVGEAAARGLLLRLLAADPHEAEAARERHPDVPLALLAARDLERLSGLAAPPLLLAEARLPEAAGAVPLLESSSAIVALDGVQDPGNVGAIVRSGVAFAVDGFLFMPGTADRAGPKVLRASAGLVLGARIAEGVDASVLAPHRDWVFALDPHEGQDLRQVPRPARFVIVAGQEGRGARTEVSARRLRIPMAGGVESLNVGHAVAAVLARWLPDPGPIR
jgi:TrmH family RNA methyltransferase